ncbi:MAG: hypothetical protein IJV80_05390 [Clostridia bacterium]|nr:hypothetical protein [Clostridia bacterium]
MKRKLAPIYAWLLLFCFLGGQVLVFVLPFLKAQDFYALMSVIGFAVSCILTPTIHELGHILFAKSQNMSIAYAKFFIFRFHRKKGKLTFSLASPFEAEQTQALPNASGNMQKRVILYTVGGLIFSAIYLFIICAFCVAFFSAVPAISYFSLGVLPYAGYLFLLNVVPFEYASGKTDTAVALGLYNEKDAEKTMLSAMEIYGFLSEGKTYGEIDRDLYFNLPVLCEDEPIYAVMLDLRYRYA